MSVLDLLATWVASIERLVSAAGGSVTLGWSPGDRLNGSAHVVISRGDSEAEPVLWESGEAEFARADGDAVDQRYFDNVKCWARADLGTTPGGRRITLDEAMPQKRECQFDSLVLSGRAAMYLAIRSIAAAE